MSGQIFIESYPLDVFGLDTPLHHLYLVHRDGNGVERVLRAGPSNDLPLFGATMWVEVNLRLDVSTDARGVETPEDRLSREITFPSLSTDEVWALMVRYATAIAEAEYPYYALDQNSNTFIGALLAAAGADPMTLLPLGIDRDAALGIGDFAEIVAEIPPPADGTLFGSNLGERLVGIQVGERIVGRGGDDEIAARGGGDAVLGGAGADSLSGGAGRDRLFGGVGDDVLEDGRGRDVMRGGDGADVFVLVPDRRADVIADFTAGEDLIDLAGVGVAGFDALEVIEDQGEVRLVFEGLTLALVRTDSPLADDDFSFT